MPDSDRVKFFSTDPDDYDGFIKELQRIIEESPPGMQAKYARLINMLSKKRNLLREVMKEVSHTKDLDDKEIYKLIIDKLQKSIREGHDNEDGFKNLLDLARLREYLAEDNANTNLNNDNNSNNEKSK